MKRIYKNNINTGKYWDNVHTSKAYPYSGLDFYLTLFHYYLPLLMQLDYIDSIDGSTILDYGCGISDRLHLIDISNINYFGYDISKSVIQYNQSEFPNLQWFSDINALQESPDYIISLHVLEHLDDPLKILKNLVSISNKGVFIQVPYKDSYKNIEHIWQFDETSFNIPGLEPVVIPGLQMNLDGDREIFMAFLKNKRNRERIIIDLYKNNLSPQAWFLMYSNCGFISYYFNPFHDLFIKIKTFIKNSIRSYLNRRI